MAMTEQQTQLVIAAKSGDVRSFEQLYSIYYEKVYGFVRMILKNERDAEDVLQETFITAWRNLKNLENPPAFSVWIQVIAKNLCNMQLRRKNMALLLDVEQDIENCDTEESEDFLPAVYAERAELKDRLGRIIDSLSDVQRQTVILYYFNQLSVDEISQITECSPNTVKSRLFLARKTIRTEVEEQERKTGQKFYGVAGIPLLSLGTLIQSHMETLLIGKGTAYASLSVITNTILNPGTAGAVGNAAGYVAAPLSAPAMAPVGTPLVEAAAGSAAPAAGGSAGSAASGAAGGGAAGGAAGGAVPEAGGATSVAADAAGYTAANTMGTTAQSLQIGMEGIGTATKLTLGAKILAGITSVAFVGAAAVLAVILITGGDNITVPDNNNPDPGSNINIDPGVNPDVDPDTDPNTGSNTDPNTDPNSSQNGNVVYDYNDLSTAVADIPRKEALNEMYILLEGFWITDGDPFVGFLFDENGNHEIMYGLFFTEFGARGRIIGGHATGDYTAELTVLFPAVPANEVNSGRPESTETIFIDIAGLYAAGSTTIKVKTDKLDNGQWNTYQYGGLTFEQALNNK